VDQVAAQKVKDLLGNYQAPELDPEIEKALLEFMDQRKAEINPK